MDTDVLIIGGGPGGLSAAYEPASKGMRVTIVDESFSFGGQLRQQTQFIDNLPQPFKRERGITLAQKLIDRLLPFDVDFLPQHTMVGAYKDGRIGISDKNKVTPVRAKKTIIATGAAEEAILFPGWTLPGVMTVGAAQILMNRERVLPGQHAVVVGSNDFALGVAEQLKAVGVEVHAIIESASHLRTKNTENIEKVKDLNIPIFLNTAITGAQGSVKVDKIYVEKDGTEMMLDVDVICLGGGLSPLLEPFEIMNCELTFQEELGGWMPKYDSNFETSHPSIYVAGNATGISCIGGILITGEMAGVNVLESLGVLTTEHAAERKQHLWEELYRIEETAGRIETFDARLSMMKDFHIASNKRFPTELDSILEGRSIG